MFQASLHCMKLINMKAYVTIPSDVVMCHFMVMTLIVRDMFMGHVGRRSNVGVVRAVCIAPRSRLHFVLRSSDVDDASEFNLCFIAFS